MMRNAVISGVWSFQRTVILHKHYICWTNEGSLLLDYVDNVIKSMTERASENVSYVKAEMRDKWWGILYVNQSYFLLLLTT